MLAQQAHSNDQSTHVDTTVLFRKKIDVARRLASALTAIGHKHAEYKQVKRQLTSLNLIGFSSTRITQRQHEQLAQAINEAEQLLTRVIPSTSSITAATQQESNPLTDQAELISQLYQVINHLQSENNRLQEESTVLQAAMQQVIDERDFYSTSTNHQTQTINSLSTTIAVLQQQLRLDLPVNRSLPQAMNSTRYSYGQPQGCVTGVTQHHPMRRNQMLGGTGKTV